MDIDWSNFEVAADHDGALELEHNEPPCYWWVDLETSSIGMFKAMKLAEEHLKMCPVWTGE